MTDRMERLAELPEYREFGKLLEDCREALRDQGRFFEISMKQYARQYADGDITEDELKKSVQGLEYPLRAWITKQSIFKRRRMNKLVSAALNHLTDRLIGAIKVSILPL